MTKTIEIEEFLELRDKLNLVDVRSPGEFAKGHVPGAINIQLFSDEQRADIGTKYKKISRDSAINKGLDIAAENSERYLNDALQAASGKELLVYCWRGGMRSEAFCKLLNAAGIDSLRLNGGYKAYKNYIREQFKRKIDIIILGGMTGSGKTEKLLAIKELGEQVIDLEGLAHHRGSAFGYFYDFPQPSNDQFENLLFDEWDKLDFTRALWLEDESRMIGRVQINDYLFAQMRNTTVIKVMVKMEDRVIRLVKDYTDFDKLILLDAFERISKRLGGENHQMAIKALGNDDYATAAEIALRYYDKAYLYGLSKRDNNRVVGLILNNDFSEDCAKQIVDFTKAKSLV